jgi:hypothetical protein
VKKPTDSKPARWQNTAPAVQDPNERVLLVKSLEAFAVVRISPA